MKKKKIKNINNANNNKQPKDNYKNYLDLLSDIDTITFDKALIIVLYKIKKMILKIQIGIIGFFITKKK